jgi:hemerythrin-like domain-containing protein
VNIFDLIRQDHQRAGDLLARLVQSPEEAQFDGTGRRDLLDRLVWHASSHEAAEEMVVWPRVRRTLDDGPSMADRALSEERDLRAQIDLLRFVSSDGDLITECRRLQRLLGEHVGFEERVLLPALQRTTTVVWSTMAAVQFRVARRLGPTRPHPNGPDRPVTMLSRGAPAVVLDHLRDRRRKSADAAAGPDAVAFITAEHARIRQIIGSMGANPDDDTVAELIQATSAHDSVERQYLYPALRSRLEGGEQVRKSLEAEHRAVAELASELRRYRFHDQARASWLAELASRLETHMVREESGVLPALAAHLTSEELNELGSALARSLPSSPTRPHTHLAGSGTGARVLRRATAPVDRVRDALRSSGSAGARVRSPDG